MKRIQAVIRPEKLEPLRLALEETDYPGMMVSKIEGHGKQKGIEQQWRGTHFKTPYIPKVKVEIICVDGKVEEYVKVIVETCASNTVGDGKIFVSDVGDSIRIRTGERGEDTVK